MNKIQLMTQAINEKFQIEYDYLKDGKSEGKRIGNPHVLYIFKAKDNTESTKCDIYQISGGTESGELKTFKMCDLDRIENIKILDTHFEEDNISYKSNSDRYLYAIAKV